MEPGSASEVRSLGNQLHGAILWVLPECLRPLNGSFLNGTVHNACYGRIGGSSAKANRRLHGPRHGKVGEGVALKVSAAVVEAKLRFGCRLGFNSKEKVSGADEGHVNVAIADWSADAGAAQLCGRRGNNHLRSHSDQVPAYSRSIHSLGENADVLDHRDVECSKRAGASLRVLHQGR